MSNYFAFILSLQKQLKMIFLSSSQLIPKNPINVDEYGENRGNKWNNAGKWAKNGEFRRLRKIKVNLSVFLAVILRWLV